MQTLKSEILSKTRKIEAIFKLETRNELYVIAMIINCMGFFAVMGHGAYNANASWRTRQAKAFPSGRWRF
jgi:hypothetical protein